MGINPWSAVEYVTVDGFAVTVRPAGNAGELRFAPFGTMVFAFAVTVIVPR
jgi:hypothetical protein